MPTYAELQEQIKKLQQQAEAIKQAEIDAVLADMKRKISQYGLTAEQLGFGSGSKKTARKTAAGKEVKVTYRNGDKIWSGAARGRKPQWVLDVQAAGEDIEKYRVS